MGTTQHSHKANHTIYQILMRHFPFWAILAVITAVFSIKFTLSLKGGNELDVLMCAKHYMDPSWIPNDWYLSQNIGYRLFFNVLFGGVARLVSLVTASFLFKLIILLLFAYVVTRLLRHFYIHPLFVIPFIAFFSFNQGFSSGEWMLGGTDTKSFAYICVLASLDAFLMKSYRRMFLLSGLATSFHILVGFYSCICLMVAFLFRIKDYKKDIIAMLSSSYLFLITSIPGLYAFFKYAFENKDVDSLLAGLIFVLYRVPHHTMPDLFLDLWQVKLLGFVIFFIALFIFSKDNRRKTIAGFAFGCILLYVTGIGIFYAGLFHWLKIYWFRFSDTMLPFLFYLSAASLASDCFAFDFSGRKKFFKGALVAVGIALSVIGTVKVGTDFSKNLNEFLNSKKPTYLISIDEEKEKILLWINNNTPHDAVFLVNPEWTYFYYLAERPMIVSFKHSPQSDKKMIEWFDRMTMIIGKNYDPKKLVRIPFKRIAMKGYSKLTKERVQAIHSRYPFNYYIAENNNIMPYQKVYAQGKYTVYKIQ